MGKGYIPVLNADHKPSYLFKGKCGGMADTNLFSGGIDLYLCPPSVICCNNITEYPGLEHDEKNLHRKPGTKRISGHLVQWEMSEEGIMTGSQRFYFPKINEHEYTNITFTCGSILWWVHTKQNGYIIERSRPSEFRGTNYTARLEYSTTSI